jgi:hypothetical protein
MDAASITIPPSSTICYTGSGTAATTIQAVTTGLSGIGGKAILIPAGSALGLSNLTLDGTHARLVTAVESFSLLVAHGVTVQGFDQGGLVVWQGSVQLSRSRFNGNAAGTGAGINCSSDITLDQVRIM